MNDLISRQQAIDAVKIGALSATTIYGRTDGGSTALRETVRAIKALPPAEPHWTPCSEGLPEENMWTICQNNAGAMMIGKYDIEFGWMFPAYFDGIVAWMPLPEAYKKGEAND